jgi:hypothetical protein
MIIQNKTLMLLWSNVDSKNAEELLVSLARAKYY